MYNFLRNTPVHIICIISCWVIPVWETCKCRFDLSECLLSNLLQLFRKLILPQPVNSDYPWRYSHPIMKIVKVHFLIDSLVTSNNALKRSFNVCRKRSYLGYAYFSSSIHWVCWEIKNTSAYWLSRHKFTHDIPPTLL